MTGTVDWISKRITELEQAAAEKERERIIQVLINQNAIRRDALGYLVCFDTNGENVIYIHGLEDDK